jgi:hypothetical protein
MSVPYALALHEDYLKTCLDLLARGGRCTKSQADRAKARLATQHTGIEEATGGRFVPDRLAQLDTLRLMRNCMIHDGSRANQALIDKIASWTVSTEAAWVKVTKGSLRHLQRGDLVEFGHPEVILSLVVTTSLAKQANRLLQSSLPRELWADLVLEDLRNAEPDLAGESLLRKARGLARFHYGSIRLNDDELSAAIARLDGQPEKPPEGGLSEIRRRGSTC